MMKKNLFGIATLLAAAAVPASAGTFLQFTEDIPTQTLFVLTNNAGTSVTISVTNGAIDYKFAIPNPLGTAFRNGLLTFTGTSTTNATSNGGNDTELGFAGSGSILDTLTNTTALSWTYGPAGAMTVNDGGTGGTYTDSTPAASEVVFFSPYLDFSIVTSESFSFGLSGASSPWAVGAGSKLASNSSSLAGTMDANPLPSIPEPTTMALMGSALVGLGLFGRKRAARK